MDRIWHPSSSEKYIEKGAQCKSLWGEPLFGCQRAVPPTPPSEKAIKELIDTDLPFPMLYGGKRKGLIAIPTRFCIEPLFHVKQRRAAFTASKILRNRIEKYFPNGTEPCIMFTAFRSILVRLNCAVKRTMHGTVKNRITIPAFHQIFISKPISNAAPLRAALTPGWNARSELC